MRLPRNVRIFRGQLDAAPFMGVFFILLIFILLHTSLVSHPGVEIELPVAGELPGPAGPTLVVAVDESGALYFENQALRRADLESRIADRVRDLGDSTTLVVQADAAVSQKRLIQVAELARRAGVRRAVLATRTGSQAARPRVAPAP